MNKIIKWESISDIEDFSDSPEFLTFLSINQPTFCIYIGHTNFKLKESDLKLLDDIEGIEAVKITSRYRLVVLVGLCFQDNWPIIMSNIEHQLDCSSSIQQEFSSSIKYLIDSKTKELNKQHSYWCIYVFPNSEIISVGGNSKEMIYKNIEFYSELLAMSGGIIVLDNNSMKDLNEFKQKNIRAIQQ